MEGIITSKTSAHRSALNSVMAAATEAIKSLNNKYKKEEGNLLKSSRIKMPTTNHLKEL